MHAGDVSRALQLAFLAPDLVEAILDGTQPVALTPERLKRARELPLLWEDQRAMLGVDELEGGDLRGDRSRCEARRGEVAEQRRGRPRDQRSKHSAAHALDGGSPPAIGSR